MPKTISPSLHPNVKPERLALTRARFVATHCSDEVQEIKRLEKEIIKIDVAGAASLKEMNGVEKRAEAAVAAVAETRAAMEAE